MEGYLRGRDIEAQAEAGLDQCERCRSRPCLWAASNRIKGRPLRSASRETAEEFGQAHHVDIGGRSEQSLEYLRGFPLITIARKAAGDQGIVVRLDRAVMIAHRIVTRLG